MKNFIYIIYFDLFKPDSVGVKNKIKAQLKSVAKLNMNVFLFFVSEDYLIGINNNEEIVYKIKIDKGFSNYRKSVFNEMKNISKEIDLDVIYVRFPGSIDFVMLQTFRFFSKVCNKVFLELPTYPINGELKVIIKNQVREKKYINAILRMFIYMLHVINSRLFLKKYINNIITFMPYEEIWDIPTIQLDNGVDIDQYPVIVKEKHKKSSVELNLVGVANLSTWHGYDRVIQGMKEYYAKKNSEDIDVNFIIVGDGVEAYNLKNMTEAYNLNKYIQFTGALDSEKIKEIYKSSDIAIGSLGMHRINLVNGSTLKVKEFCASGIPFIYAYNESSIPNDWEYALKIPADESFVDIVKLIGFYNNVSKNKNFNYNMNKFALNHYSWDVQMKNLFKRGKICK